MAKTIVTYSWLARKAMALCRKDRSEYERLLYGDHCDKLLRGCLVEWRKHDDWSQCFLIRDRASGNLLFTVWAAYQGDEAYTYYEPKFTTSQYRKRLVEKYFPVTLPEGVRTKTNLRGGNTNCTYHNADGSEAAQGIWHGGRRNRCGTPSRTLLIRDRDGQFVMNRPELADHTGEALFELGWFDNASPTRKDWLASIAAMPENLINRDKVLTVAAKAWLAASRMCEKYPRMRMALFPASIFSDHLPRSKRLRYGQHEPNPLVMSRSDAGIPELWYMPEVLVYWKEQGEDRERYVYLSMVVPPHGNQLLDPTGRAGMLSRSVRKREQAMERWNPVPLPLGYECAYHGILANAPTVPRDQRYNPGPSAGCYGYGSDEARNREAEAAMVVWPQHPNRVRVELKTRYLNGEDLNLPLDFNTPVAMTPEEVMLAFEEKMLMSSLPLC
jgi:hypothetical protein